MCEQREYMNIRFYECLESRLSAALSAEALNQPIVIGDEARGKGRKRD